jgi:hypothetical protein
MEAFALWRGVIGILQKRRTRLYASIDQMTQPQEGNGKRTGVFGVVLPVGFRELWARLEFGLEKSQSYEMMTQGDRQTGFGGVAGRGDGDAMGPRMLGRRGNGGWMEELRDKLQMSLRVRRGLYRLHRGRFEYLYHRLCNSCDER